MIVMSSCKRFFLCTETVYGTVKTKRPDGTGLLAVTRAASYAFGLSDQDKRLRARPF